MGTIKRVGAPDDPPVLLLHPWWGVTAAVDEWADELARAGHHVVIPDRYGGRLADTVEGAEALQQELEDDAATRLVEEAADEVAALGRPWVAMGFSMGAYLACHLAGRGDTGPDELILFYSGQPPAGPVTRTRRAVLHIAPGDPYFTDDEVAETEEALRTAGATVETFRYEGSGHWFAERGSPGFDKAAFDLARSRVLDQLTRS